MSERDIGVGIIGYGWVAGAHIDAMKSCEGTRVVGICSSRRQDPDELSSRHGTPLRYFGEVNDLLRDPEVDVVSICSVHPRHPDQAIAAAEAGKHLIIEKPLGLSLADCRRIEAAVAKAGVRTCVCFECRYSSQFKATRAVIEQGLLGRLHYGEIDYYHGIGPWYGQYRWNVKKELGGSSLLTAGCHALDALLLCMEGEVEEVSAFSTKPRSGDFAAYEYDTTSVAILRFSDGRVAKVTSCIDCLQPYYFHVHLVGSEGSLLDNRFHSTRLAGLNKNQWSTLSLKLLDSGDVSDHPYASQFAAFFDVLRNDAEMPLTSLREAMRTHEVMFAIEHSLATGRPVNVREYLNHS